MADYNSSQTGAEVDEAVATVKGSATGILVKTGTGSGRRNTITGTADEIAVTNGDGVAGDTILALDSAVTTSLALADTALQSGDIADFETTTELNSRDTANRDRANHTGTQLAATISDFSTAASAAAPVQPSDITNFETTTELNSRDTANRDRTNHTGTQLAATISDFSTAASAAAPVQPSDITNFETTTELNSRDTANRDRANHTGTQAASTITGLATIATTGAYSDLIGAPDLSTFDDVLLYANLAAFPASGELGKVYVAEDSGYIYRWDSAAYVQLTDQTAIWGQISGTLSNQTDLQTALNTKLESTDIADFETTTELNSRDTANRDRANHTGTQAASTITGLAIVATSGSYNDLTDQPIFSSDLDGLTDVTITALTDEQILQYDAATSQWVNVNNAGGAGVPGGADTQVQFNDGGAFGGDSDFTYNKTTNELSLAGDIVALTSDLTVKVSSDPTGVTGADAINNIISLTQAEYDAITPNASTFYVIV